MLGDFSERAVESAAAGFDQMFGRAAHALHFFGVFQEVDHFDAGIFGALHLDSGAGFDEAGRHVGEIFHRRAEDGDFAEGGGLKDVVAARIDEGTADKDAVGEAVEGGKFTDGVEEQDGGIVGDGVLCAVFSGNDARAGQGEFGAANEFAMGFLDKFGGGGEAFGLARSEDEKGFRKITLDDAENEQGEGLFGGDDTAGDDERPAAAAQALFFEPLGERRRRGKLEIVFQIAADGDTVRGRAEGTDAVRVLFGLHQEGSRIAESGLEKRLEIETEYAEIGLPAGEGTIGDASADEKDGYFVAAGFAEEIGPDFGFQDDDERGFCGVEDAADAEGPVQGKINDRIGEGHTLFDQGIAGEGGGGDDEGALGIGCFQPLREGEAGEGLADRDGVDPDGAGPVGGEFLEFRNGKAEALGEVGEIFAVAKALDQPIGRR